MFGPGQDCLVFNEKGYRHKKREAAPPLQCCTKKTTGSSGVTAYRSDHAGGVEYRSHTKMYDIACDIASYLLTHTLLS